MPRGKRSTPESTATGDTVVLTDAEPKAKGASTNVILVKPVQTETETNPDGATVDAEPAAKLAARPKVGRAAGSRKKKAEDKESKTDKAVVEKTDAEKPEAAKSVNEKAAVEKADAEKPAKKEKKSRSKSDAQTVPGAAEPAEVVAVTEAPVEPKKTESSAAAESKPVIETKLETPPAAPKTPDILSEAATAKNLHEELAQVELSPEWEPSHSRPWSFRSILVGVILFVAINLGFMALFSAYNHKANVTTQASAPSAHVEPATPAQLGEDAPALAAKTSSTVSSLPVIPSAPSATSSEAPAAAAQPAKPLEASPMPAALPAVTIEPSATTTTETAAPVTPVSSRTEPAAASAHEPEATLPTPPADTAAPSSPQSITSIAAAPAVASGGATSEQEKAQHQQELLSILNKDE